MTQAMHRVLMIEDDAAIRSVVRVLLEANSFRIIEAGTAFRGHVEARSHKPDLLLVDLGLPDGDGISVIREVRRWSQVPIIVLSARTQEEQKIEAFDAGADDYVTKPFSARELLARVRAALRRNARGGERAPLLKMGVTQIDLAKREACGPSGVIHFTPLEYRVLECLSRQVGMIVRREQLITEVWGPGKLGDSRNLRACIKSLRAKLEADPQHPEFLETETGIGYRLRTETAVGQTDSSTPD